MEQIKLQVETTKIIKLLASEIYDSPYALLRENIQNAYDAILMRLQIDNSFDPKIEVKINGNEVIISDNGIGMDLNTLKNNYWKAGSSGKNNDEARRAGVVGTFGIGAMANFGICKHLKIETHYFGSNTTIISDVEKDKLSISEECINVDMRQENIGSGTIIYATLDDSIFLDNSAAVSYILPYIQYLEIPIIFNGKLLSKKVYYNNSHHSEIMSKEKLTIANIQCDIKLYTMDSNGSISIYINNIFVNGCGIKGDIFLTQGQRTIFGLRNKFGLATLPLNSVFIFGGIVNLSILQPTAGREAISRDSIQFVSNIIMGIEKISAEELAKHDACDRNHYFLNYIYTNHRYDLANKVKIQALPERIFCQLGNLQRKINGKEVVYYSGDDRQIIEQYSNENTLLLLLSNDNPRRNIQQYIVTAKGIEQVSDNPKLLCILDEKELSSAEFAVILRIGNILKDDYLISESNIYFAEISHRAPNLVDYKNNMLYVYLSRDSANLLQVINIYKESYELFDPFVKDYVRNYLYQKIMPYVPSSTRQGADALYKILQRKRELYTIGLEDLGEIELLLKDLKSGKIDRYEFINITLNARNQQKQTVRSEQIGELEHEFSNIVCQNNHNTLDENIVINADIATPSIRMLDNNTAKKILKTEIKYPQLNNFSLFLGLSDNLYQKHNDFFLEPHTTKVIWSMHKIIYIFTHVSNRITLYYEIELRDILGDNQTGGQSIPTTTIISKNRIFIPIIDELKSIFEIKNKQLSFHVRYDLISDLESDD